MPWFRALQRRLDFPVRLRYGRWHYYVKAIRDFSVVLPNKSYLEPLTHEAFEKLFRHLGARTFLDIGANVGTFSWHALGLDPALRVHLFEPDVTNQGLLERTIRANGFTTVSLCKAAISNAVGKASFLVDEASGATGGLADHTGNPDSLQYNYGMGRRVEVETSTLDAYFEDQQVANPVLIKIDVEGVEAEVFEGGRGFLERNRPWIIVECFTFQNLKVMVGSNYHYWEIPEGGNYVLAPSERAEEAARLLGRTFRPLDAAAFAEPQP
ncbi:MAG TPA: FkbM family methyltransferase [Candidatus Methylacidiphilales bacterium]